MIAVPQVLETYFLAVAQTVGFGLGRPKMLYLSIGID
jgi:hypothetical protein